MPRTRGGALWRFAAAAVIVIGFSAATTAVAGLLQVKDIVDALNLTSPLKNAQVQLPSFGAPQTILLIGSDHRATSPSYRDANTDTMMLVRIDDKSSTLNVLSIPRDLRVQLPDGISKLNAAYSEGGPNLLIKTMQHQVFPGLVVNHILDVNFSGFEDMVDAIGCVYSDVDHRYYNVSAPGVNNYSSINVQAGYQKLCGANALSFVRFRHTDSDLVRNARQQSFLRWAKDQYGISQLLSNRNTLLKIFGKHVQTDRSLHTTDQIIDLFNLVVNAQRLAVRQIKFPAAFDNGCGAPTLSTVPGQFIPSACADYVVPTSRAAERQVYRQFITPTQLPAHTARKHHKKTKLSTAGLVADLADGRSQAAGVAKVPFPVYYPKLMFSSAAYCLSITANCDDGGEPETEYAGSYPRVYHIDGAKHRYSAYRMTLVINSALGEYYGIQGMNWLHPPILNNPSGTRTIHGRKLMLFANGSHLSMVAWRTKTSSYWVSNSLTDTLDNAQMLEIAASFTRAQ
jgi:LCP family protein required for cell wall assembly